MRPLHRPLVSAVLEALDSTFNQNFYADKVIERTFKHNRAMGSRDRKFVAETVYECVRWWRLLCAQAGIELKEIYSEEEIEAVLAQYLKDKEYQKVNWLPDPKTLKFESSPAIEQSVPDWMYDLGSKEIGEGWDDVLEASNKPAKLYVRTNSLKTSREELLKKFKAEDYDVENVGDVDSAIRFKKRVNVFSTKLFKQGLFEVQDAGSQMIAPFMQLEPGQRVIDACAGAGGKSLHIAALLKNKGKLIAMDIHQHKLNELRKRMSRAGVDIAETRTIDSTKVVKRLKESCDRLLLDVPCSGLGVLRRNPDSKWKLEEQRIQELRELQSEIIASYSRMLKPGGKMVYATCSVLPSENQKQVQKFIEANEGWELEDEFELLPHKNDFDGFYAARLKKL